MLIVIFVSGVIFNELIASLQILVFYFFAFLIIFDWIPDIVNFILLGAIYLHIAKLYSRIQLLLKII